MKKFLLSILFMFLMVSVYAQQEQQQCYRYSIVRVVWYKKAYVIKMDDGVKDQVMQNESGKDLQFKSPAGALNYLVSIGWEFDKVETIPNSISATRDIRTKSYWIFRKSCSKEELNEIVRNNMKEE